ncbi:MAG: SgcJ/EcaC family oxidoreductase [Candidatus Acidiferrales bacterium]|jgi:uncharacterized protein (TIGR02246 family)
MQTKLALLALSLLLIPAAVRAQGGGAPTVRGSVAEIEAIAAVETQWQEAWNSHDVPAMVSLFAPDADVINLAGEWFQGREAFAESLKLLHSGKVKESAWKTEQVQVKFLTPGIAVVHVYFSSSGERNPDGSLMPPRRGIFTRVEVKRDGHWLISASQATKIVPPETARAGGGFGEPGPALAQLRP